MRYIYILFTILLFLTACEGRTAPEYSKPQVAATTGIIADIVKIIGGDFVDVRPLMRPNMDPHQYKASEGDVLRLAGANAIFYNGLGLEGKLSEVLARAEGTIPAYAVTATIPLNQLIIENGVPDPHVWFDPNIWILAVSAVTDGLCEIDPENSLYYRRNEETYIAELLALDTRLREMLAVVPIEKRVLVTAHNAFAYFGKAYDWDVVSVQGMNTAGEASVYSMQQLAKSLVAGHIGCIFAESSISRRPIEALTASTIAMGGKVHMGHPLYSDSLGEQGSGAESYTGMLIYNVQSIVSGVLNE